MQDIFFRTEKKYFEWIAGSTYRPKTLSVWKPEEDIAKQTNNLGDNANKYFNNEG